MNPKDKKPFNLKDQLLPIMGGLFMASSLMITLFYYLDVNNSEKGTYGVPIFTFLWCGILFLSSMVVLVRGLCLIGKPWGKELRGLVTFESLIIYLTLCFHALQSRGYWDGSVEESSPLSPSSFMITYTFVAAVCFIGSALLIVITLVPGYSERMRLAFIFYANAAFIIIFAIYFICALAGSSFAAGAYFYIPCILCLALMDIICLLRIKELKKE